MKRAIAILMMFVAMNATAATLHDVFNTGETLDYDLTWTHISGGAARMTIAAIDADRYRITSVAK